MDTLPANIPANIRALLDTIVARFRATLGNNLIGIYLHGSAAMGCYNPVKSDLDLLIVVKESLSVETKRTIIGYLLELADQTTKKGLELSVVTRDAIQNFRFPTPYELHFSNGWRERYVLDQVDFEQERFDTDLAAHFTVTKRRGIRLYGEPIQAVFPGIPGEYYLRSIAGDAEDIFENITNDPMYGVLNLCRVLAFIRDKVVLSKLEGGHWGLQHLPQAYQSLIQQALEAYQATDDGDVVWDDEKLREFAGYMKSQIDENETPRAAPEKM